jgi:hypothetical protein
VKAKPIQVKMGTPGVMVDAVLVVCAECDGENFTIYFIDEHQHIECLACHTTYCGKGENCAAGIEQ